MVAFVGTSVGPTSQGVAAPVPDNCHTIIVVNPSLLLTLLVGIAVPGGALTRGVNCISISPLASITLSVQTFRFRFAMDQAQVAGSGLAFDAVGGAITGEVAYVNTLGSP